MYRFDVVIVGGGTAGLYAAYNLAKFGFSVCVVEQKSVDSLYKITGDAIGKHHIDRHGIDISGIVENFYKGALVYSPDEDVRLKVPGEGYALDISGWLKRLASMALSRGVTILDKTTFTKPIVDGKYVVGVRCRRDGDVEIYSKVVIDASGATAVVRTRLPWNIPFTEPLKYEDVSYAYREVVELDSEPEEREYIRIYLNQNIAPGGYWWFFPKKGSVVNVGLGIWGKYVKELKYSPLEFYKDKLLKVRRELQNRKIINSGGGIVPTRRPLETLAWYGIVAIGDAGVTVNPVHGGGLGPALLSAKLASETIAEAWERGSMSLENLWNYNIKYIEEYGKKQAKLDIFRLALQHMNNEEIERGLKAGLVDESEVLSISSEARTSSIFDKLKKLLKLRKVPFSLARKLILSFTYMKKIEKLYDNYPRDPKDLDLWIEKLRKLYSDYLKTLKKI